MSTTPSRPQIERLTKAEAQSVALGIIDIFVQQQIGWTQGVYAGTRDGQPVYCAVGAMKRLAGTAADSRAFEALFGRDNLTTIELDHLVSGIIAGNDGGVTDKAQTLAELYKIYNEEEARQIQRAQRAEHFGWLIGDAVRRHFMNE